MIDRAKEIYREEGVTSLARSISDFLYYRGRSNRLLRPLVYPPLHYKIHNWRWKSKYGSGTPIMEEDWDNLVLLDACRYDEFVEQNPFDSPAKRRISLGSNTTEFLKRNFLGKRHYDTVYLTANPKSIKLESGDYGDERMFHTLIPILEDWDPETHTVLPETVRERAVDVHDRFRNKRLLIHFVQPHLPFLGETMRTVREEQNVQIDGFEFDFEEYPDDLAVVDVENVTLEEAITDEEYDLTVEDVKEMYRETLRITLSEVQRLVKDLRGKTIITADHGEMFGERPVPFTRPRYAHPKGIRTTELCVVPRVDLEADDRKEIVSERPLPRKNYDEELVESRLEALGYR